MRWRVVLTTDTGRSFRQHAIEGRNQRLSQPEREDELRAGHQQLEVNCY